MNRMDRKPVVSSVSTPAGVTNTSKVTEREDAGVRSMYDEIEILSEPPTSTEVTPDVAPSGEPERSPSKSPSKSPGPHELLAELVAQGGWSEKIIVEWH